MLEYFIRIGSKNYRNSKKGYVVIWYSKFKSLVMWTNHHCINCIWNLQITISSNVVCCNMQIIKLKFTSGFWSLHLLLSILWAILITVQMKQRARSQSVQVALSKVVYYLSTCICQVVCFTCHDCHLSILHFMSLLVSKSGSYSKYDIKFLQWYRAQRKR